MSTDKSSNLPEDGAGETRFARRGRSTVGRMLVLVAGATLMVLAGVVLVRTLMFTATLPPPLRPDPSIEVDEAAAAERLAGAVRIRTVTRSQAPRLDPAVFAEFRAYLRRNFPLAHTRLSTETVDRHSLLFRWEGRDASRSPVLLLAHQDVVPVEEGAVGAWTHPPFDGVIADGFIWGRGTLDDKQGVVGILEAVELLLRAGFQPERTIYLAFGHDEEVGGEGARAIAARLEAQSVKLAFVIDEGGVVTRGIVPDIEGWVALVGIAEKGYVSLALRTKSDGGHSSMPPDQTAVGVLAAAVTALEADPFPPRTEGSRRFFAVVGPHMPFVQRMIFANLWLFEPIVVTILSQRPSTNATLRTTTAATIFRGGLKDNLLPTEAEAVLNFRIMPGETPASVKARVEAVVDDERVRVAFYEGESAASPPSRFANTEGEGFMLLSETIRQVAQDESLIVAPYLVVGATDARHFEGVADDAYRFVFNRFGPGDIARVHGIDERISIRNFGETVRFYATLMKRMAGPKGS